MARAKTQFDLFLRLAVAAHNFKAHGKQRDRDQLTEALDVAWAYLDPKDLQGTRPTAEAVREAEAVKEAERADCAACGVDLQRTEDTAARLAEQTRKTLNAIVADLAAARAEARTQEARALRLVAYARAALISSRERDKAGDLAEVWAALAEADRYAIDGGTVLGTGGAADLEAQRRADVLKRAGHTVCHVLAAGLPAGLCAGRHTCTTGPADCPGRG
jgi:hypothetical protein